MATLSSQLPRLPRVRARSLMRWPLPALLAWSAAWVGFAVLARAGAPLAVAVPAAATLGALPALAASTPWRRCFVAAGFPLSVLGSGLAHGVPAWIWLLPLAALALVYPLGAWRDAPMFPTPPRALDGLDRLVDLPPTPRVLDAGCGMGHGLQALRRAWPQARLQGIERSWPLRLIAALRCPGARIRQGDMWARPWHGADLVYLFQRPESMARAYAKAEAELRPGSWLASLEFEVPGIPPDAVLHGDHDRPVWLYRLGGTSAADGTLKNTGAMPTTSSRMAAGT